MAEPVQADLFASSPPPPETSFLGWDRPLVDLATGFLRERFPDSLASTVVVVPTRQSARRLRDALQLASVPPPHPAVVTPEFLYSPTEDTAPRVASHGETLFAWALTLQQANFAQLRQLFPLDPPDRGFGWAMGTAADLLKLRTSLGEAGLLIGDVPERLGDSFGDTPRWRDLAVLEQRATARLAEAGLRDAAAARQALAESPQLPEGFDTIALIGLPDPPDIAIHALEGLADRHEIHVAVYAPESEAARFDHWGRPTEEGWANCEIDIPDPEHAIQLAADPPAQAGLAAEAIAAHEDPAGLAALAVADAELAPHLATALARRGLPTHHPGGAPFSSHELHALLRLLSDLLATRAFPPAAELARHPDFLDAAAASFEGEDGEAFDPAAALAAIDSLAADHLPASLADARAFAKHAHPSARHLLERVAHWADRLARDPLAESLPEFLAQTFAAREFDLAEQEGASFAEIARSLRETLTRAAPLAGSRLSNSDALELAIAVLRGEPLLEPKQPGAVDLHGWLEMLWEDSPHVVVAGANDGKLPEAMGGDSFLPNKTRKALGVRDSTDRLVRDSYLLSAVLAPRSADGRVDLILGRTSDAGDPLRPSRLLFRCQADALPARALRLCRGEDLAPEPGASWAAAWELSPPPISAESKLRERISVTGFRAYLDCPFRFYLKHGLRMEEVETDKFEMNARDFGNICHLALDAFGKDEVLRDSTDAGEIRDFLLAQLDARARSRYGRELSVPLEFQFESAKQRLAWAAERQAAERAAGWRIERCEWEIHGEHDWKIGGLSVSGIIDRVERHQETGAWRVLDYKTSSNPKPPREAHLSNFKRGESQEDLPTWAVFELGEKTQRWSDLQLPLYAIAIQELLGAEEVVAGYFNLAPSAGDTKIATWDEVGETLLYSARRCAEGVAAAITDGQFWPPAEHPNYDDFAGILFGDPSNLANPPTV